jgi:regulatory protein
VVCSCKITVFYFVMERKVTALKVQKRNPQRVNVYLDGEFAFGLSHITAAWLQIGQTLDDDRVRELQTKDEAEVAYQKALHFLSFRPRAELEVTQNLRKHNFPDGVIQTVLERLGRSGLVNDHSFAQTWVENRSEFRPRGRRALRLELRQKGIMDEVIETVLRDLDEDKLAYRAAHKQARKYRRLEWPDYRKKMTAFLARRGFNYGTAAPVVEKVWLESKTDLD